MKKALLPLLISVLFVFTGCSTVKFSSQPVSDRDISPLQTFSITPPAGDFNLFNVAPPEGIAGKTVNALAAQLTKRGYTQVAADASPDFIVTPAWMISMGSNPEYQLNAGSFETAQQISPTQQVATLDVTVSSGATGQKLWYNSSPWPFSVRFATGADIENAAVWVMDRFPTQEEKQTTAAGQ